MAIEKRVWSKGSARGAGPTKQSGTVRTFSFKHPDRTCCPCGRIMLRCDNCGALHCNAPGHLQHACGGAA